MQILNLSGHGINVHVDGGRLVVKDGNHADVKPKEKRFRRKTLDFDKLVISGSSGNISLAAIKWITKQKRDIAILDWNGRLVSAISAPLANLGMHKLAQYKVHHDEAKKTKIARWIIEQKIEGSLKVLAWIKTRRPDFDYDPIIDRFASQIKKASTLKEIQGIESAMSSSYWRAIISTIDKRWEFISRTFGDDGKSIDADDPVNALFNYGFAILESEVWKAVNTVGLEPYIGFIHKTHTNKAPLIYDLEEPFRWIIEKSVLRIVYEKQVTRSDFITTDEGNVRLKASAINKVINEIASQFTSKVLYGGVKRQWQTMIILKTREMTKMFPTS